jgi:hypothetical protein
MRVGRGCYRCLVEQAGGVLDHLEIPDRERVMARVLEFLEENYRLDAVPAVLGSRLHHLLMEITGNPDPFKEEKRESNEVAISLLPYARARMEASGDPLASGFRVAMAGNLMDFGIYRENTPAEELKAALDDIPVIDHTERVKALLKEPKDILYLLDNAGEIVFDRLLMEVLTAMGHRITAAVKSSPIVNDATMADAEIAGIKEVCRVIETGTNYVGVVPELSSEELVEAFRRADLIIAKGQGSYETLSDYREKPILFLLKAKCSSVAGDLEVPQKSSVVLLNLPHDQA